jgi:hypothetical protein
MALKPLRSLKTIVSCQMVDERSYDMAIKRPDNVFRNWTPPWRSRRSEVRTLNLGHQKGARKETATGVFINVNRPRNSSPFGASRSRKDRLAPGVLQLRHPES